MRPNAIAASARAGCVGVAFPGTGTWTGARSRARMPPAPTRSAHPAAAAARAGPAVARGPIRSRRRGRNAVANYGTATSRFVSARGVSPHASPAAVRLARDRAATLGRYSGPGASAPSRLPPSPL